MTLPFKVIAVDMDGTFLNDDHDFDHELFDQVLTELEKRKIHFVVASGRPYMRLKADFKDFYKRMDFVTCNGARLVVADKERECVSIHKKTALEFMNYLYDNYGKCATLVYQQEVSYMNNEGTPEAKKFLKYFGHTVVTLDDLNDMPDKPVVEMTFHHKSDIVPQLAEGFNKTHEEKVTLYGPSPIAIDVVAQGTSKASMLETLLKDLGATKDELIAFGDGGNDIPMLDLAKYSYVMENGMDSAKKHAKYIAPSNNDSGVLKVLQEYLEKDPL